MTEGEFGHALAALGEALSATGAPFMVIGGVAVIARGVVRQTDDIDATLWAPGLAIEDVIRELANAGIVGRIGDLREFAEAAQVLLLRHEASGTPIEVSFAWLPFEEEALRRAEPLELAGSSLPVASPEDLVIYKSVAWRDRDRADIERLLRLHGHTIDERRVLDVVRQFAEALDEPERVPALELLLESVKR